MFQHVDAYAGDPILSMIETFERDTRARKVNLSVGLYYDAAGRIPVLDCVREAQHRIDAQPVPQVYLPMEGLAGYRTGAQRLIFGADQRALREGRIATVQTVGGSGALKIGADFLRRYFPESHLWVSDPTWDNHVVLFGAAGFKVHTYPYYDAATGGLRFDAMLATLAALPEKSIVLLHPCCHNPTGVDPSPAQWAQVTDVLKARNVIPFLDMAYQGFGMGIEEDAGPVRMMADAGLPIVVAQSFSKNLSLYGERVGSLSVVAETPVAADAVLGQLKATVRGNYSSPPRHGGTLVSTILNDAALFAGWIAEVAPMRDRIRAMRDRLHAELKAQLPDRDVRYFVTQNGMFSYTGLTGAEVDRLREEFAIYLIRSGRMCVAGLSEDNVGYVGESFAQVLRDRHA
ncbi:aromatic amino acid transaminase [Robbsia andropogonis]|uniref:amino acid aminotransferase n=1 Tax=Robbsia andropogonis TaxID=28092 RepID=UPI003D2180EB